MRETTAKVRLGRREFLQSTAAATLGLGAGAVTARDALAEMAAPDPSPRVKRYGTLGRTGLRISDISMGTGSTADPKLIRYAYDRGITYFDTAEGYPMGGHGLAEKSIGTALSDVRGKVVITSKTATKSDTRRGAAPCESSSPPHRPHRHLSESRRQ
jgi:hypothetical protein